MMLRIALISMFMTSAALADIWTVDDDGKAHFDTIQAAIIAASDGDEILVYPGTYTLTSTSTLYPVVNMLGKSITLRSSEGADVTIIDGGGSRRGLLCDSGETQKTIIDGFTITDGYVSGWGGCIYISDSSPTITNCTISGGSTGTYAGGIYIQNNNASPRFSNCLITDNSVSSVAGGGGGIYCTVSCSPIFENCEITNNTSAGSGGGIRVLSSDIMLTDCTISGNVASGNAGGIDLLSNSSATLTNCNISDNSAGAFGGGLYASGAIVIIDGSAIANNTSIKGGGIAIFDNSAVQILMSQITTNAANIGGGMYVDDLDSDVVISGSIVGCNTATISHPQIYGNYSNVGGNCIVFGDCTDTNGDGIPDECDAVCGDGVCSFGEDEISCPEDCATDVVCGDGICEGYENCVSCPGDCGECTILHVDDDLLDNPNAEFTSIQAAIEAIVEGGEIIVSPGTYISTTNPVVDMLGKTITLRSSDGQDVTFIDGEGVRRGIHCRSGETHETVIDGFTITNGYIYAGGGCIHIIDSSPTFLNCIISNSSTGWWGGGIYIQNETTSPRFTNCTITGNTSTEVGAKGGGIYCGVDCSPIFENCLITNNTTAGNGGGIYALASEVTIINCTISGNTAVAGDGVFNSLGSEVSFVGQNSSDEIWSENTGTTLSFSAGSICTVNGDVSQLAGVSTTFDLDEFDANAPLQSTDTFAWQGSLSITNDSKSLLTVPVPEGDIISLAQAGTFETAFDSIVFPLMPDGLGLHLIEQTAVFGGGSTFAAEVIKVEGANFADPFTSELDSAPVDIVSFDADGDGRDEIAILFGGTPGGVAVYNVHEEGVPTPIEGLSAFVGYNPVSIDAADLNDDGYEDLLVANSTDNTISVLLTMQDSDRSLYFDVTTLSVPGSSQLVSCGAIIDWDGDADLDAVVGVDRSDPYMNDAYQVLLDLSNSPTAGVSFDIPKYQLGEDKVADPVTAVDGVGGSGFVGGTRYGRIHHADSESGALQLLAELSGNNIVTIEAMDLDDNVGDGLLDLMVASDEAETIYLLQGDKSEADGFGDLIPLAVSEEVKDVVAFDADFDGDMDLVMTAPNSANPLILLRNDGVTGLLSDGLQGRTWSKQVINSTTPTSTIVIAGLSCKDEKDCFDTVVGGGSSTTFRGDTLGVIEQTNIRLIASCPSDFNEDGMVDVNDLLLLIAAWGSCDTCPEDLNSDGVVDVNDLLLVIAAWGSCE